MRVPTSLLDIQERFTVIAPKVMKVFSPIGWIRGTTVNLLMEYGYEAWCPKEWANTSKVTSVKILGPKIELD